MGYRFNTFGFQWIRKPLVQLLGYRILAQYLVNMGHFENVKCMWDILLYIVHVCNVFFNKGISQLTTSLRFNKGTHTKCRIKYFQNINVPESIWDIRWYKLTSVFKPQQPLNADLLQLIASYVWYTMENWQVISQG